MPPGKTGKKRESNSPTKATNVAKKNKTDHPSTSGVSKSSLNSKGSKTSEVVKNKRPKKDALQLSESETESESKSESGSESETESVGFIPVLDKVESPTSSKKVKPIIVDATYQAMLNLIETSNKVFSKKPSMAIKGAIKFKSFVTH
jgi:hypothetical protein